MQTVRGETEAIIEERRPVELVHLYMVGERGAEALHLLPTFVDDDGELRPNPVAARLDGRGPDPRRAGAPAAASTSRGAPRSSSGSPTSACCPRSCSCSPAPAATRRSSSASTAGIRLTDSAERVALRRIADAHLEALDDADLDVLGYDTWLAGLEAGVAAHHAGMVPPMKEAVEEAFAAGLLQGRVRDRDAVARHQHAGPLGRGREAVEVHRRAPRAADAGGVHPARRAAPAGAASTTSATRSCCGIRSSPFEQVAGLASRRTYALTSSFRATYNMAANLVQRYEREEARRLLDLSFAQFHADRDAVSLTRQLERTPRAARAGARRRPQHPERRRRGVPRAARRASTTRAAPRTRRRRAGSTSSGPATS